MKCACSYGCFREAATGSTLCSWCNLPTATGRPDDAQEAGLWGAGERAGTSSDRTAAAGAAPPAGSVLPPTGSAGDWQENELREAWGK